MSKSTQAFDHSTRDPRVTPATGDLVIPAGRKKPLVSVWSSFYSLFGGSSDDNISFVFVNADCKDGEEAERRISKRRGMSIRFKSLAEWRKLMADATVLATNDEPYVVWDDSGAHKQPSKEDPEYIRPS